MMIVFFKISEVLQTVLEFPIVNILIENGPDDDWQTCKSQIIEGDVKIIEKCLTAESIVEAKIKLGQGKNDVFIIKVEDHFTIPNIAPSTMYEKQLPKELKLPQSEI